jgi:hypothetical protein
MPDPEPVERVRGYVMGEAKSGQSGLTAGNKNDFLGGTRAENRPVRSDDPV